MILEHAILNVKPGETEAFEKAMNEALPLISASAEFKGLEVRRCIENPDRYVLLVKWETVEAHDPGFRGSDRYPRWKALLHHFYDPFPVVEHYGEPVAAA
jgi:heme-degrading monooxygenase HmoA